MDDNLISFRCPEELLEVVDALAAKRSMSRSCLINMAIEELNKRVIARGGRLVPPYEPGSISLDIPALNKDDSDDEPDDDMVDEDVVQASLDAIEELTRNVRRPVSES